MAELAAKDFFGHGSIEAYEHLFRTDGKTWATLKTLNIAHKYFKEIKDTGVLAIFPFGLEANAIKVRHGMPFIAAFALMSVPTITKPLQAD